MALPAGVPAIIVLAVTLLGSGTLGLLVARERGSVQGHAAVMALTAAVFWVWALERVVARAVPDAGVISFACPMLAAAYIFCRPSRPLRYDPGCCDMIAACAKRGHLAMICCAVPSVNYLIPAFVLFIRYPTRWPLGVYFVLGGLVWAALAVSATRLHERPPSALADWR